MVQQPDLPTPVVPKAYFRKAILTWYGLHGRKHLPWQQDMTPYKVWISEIMLQQTQVATVIPYFERFMASFPSVHHLAHASQDDVLHHWTGLGYYARGRNLHKAAQRIVEDFAGLLPENLDALQSLPGIGLSTAGAILASGFEKQAAILDGNVKRVLARFHAVPGWYGQSSTLKQLWHYSQYYTPSNDIRAYTQAMMDLGAMICTRSKPKCHSCPLSRRCVAFNTQQQQRFPESKPKKQLPIKQSQFIILQNSDAEVLLEQRPPHGLWGGLWCFPEIDTDLSLVQWCHNQFNVIPLKEQKLPRFRHTFSHFHLDVSPILFSVEKTTMTMAQQHRIWYKLDQEPDRGFAAPVKRLLNSLCAATLSGEFP